MLLKRLLLTIGISWAFDTQQTATWASWSEWSQCDRTCGHGLKVRTRQCVNGFPGNNGCIGASSESVQCAYVKCQECIASQWAFQLDETAPMTQLVRTQRNNERQFSSFSLCTRLAPSNVQMRGTIVQYSKSEQTEPSIMIAARSDYLMKRQKFDIITAGEINSLEVDGELIDGWICLVSGGDTATLQYNEQKWSWPVTDSIVNGGGIMSAGLGIAGNLTDTFLVGELIDYNNLSGDLCFDAESMIGSLSPTDLISATGAPFHVKSWAPWEDWGECSVTCGGGARFRIRECLGGEPGDEGCHEGTFADSEPCMVQQCPIGWRRWSEWSPCSNSCEEGVQIRIRECIGGGKTCEQGDTSESRPCRNDAPDQKGCMYSSWHFPKEVSISNYIMVKPLLNNMTDASFCYWLTSGYDGINGTVFSYSHGEQWTGNSLAIMGSTSPELGLSLFIFRKNEKLVIPNDFAPMGERILNCIVLKRDELTNRPLMQFYVNDRLQNYTELETEDDFMIEDKGELIIGQDQDCLLGCFDEPQALTGDLDDFSVWDSALTLADVQKMYQDGFPSIENTPKVTLAPSSCEKHGRIHFQSVWGEWNDWSKCSVTCQTGTRTRQRNCYGDECEGDYAELKECEQGPCIASIDECSQSKWSITSGSQAKFKSAFNAVAATMCALVQLEDMNASVGSVFAMERRKKSTIEFGLDLVNDFIQQKNQSDFDFDVESIRVCLAVAESTLDYYIESELVLETSLDQFDVTRSDYFVLGGGEFEGQIHDFAVWDRYMEADEIQALFENGCHAAATQAAFIDTQPIVVGSVQFIEGWSEWSEWTPCSASCAEIGNQMRTRRCYSLDEESGSCVGSNTETSSCGPLICPSWSEWSHWSSCSKTCDAGFSHRTRSCLNGDTCVGESSELDECLEDICPDPYDFPWECGTVTANTGGQTMRIVNGKTEAYGAVPYLCHLSSYGSHSCGTSVISPVWNIGAAHCVQDYDTPEQFRIICGSHHRTKIDTYEQQRAVKQYIKHPNYDYLSESVDYDMMLFEVDQAWDFTDYVKPICLPKRGEYPDSGMLCKVSGWGSTKAKDMLDANEYYSLPELAEYAQSVYVPITEMGICAAGYKSITRRQFCAGFIEGGKDACQGDSGGPLACPVGIRGTYQLTGVVSHGIGCGMQSFPGVYTRVESLVDWILSYVTAQGPDSAAVCSSEQEVDLKTGGINSPNFDGRTVYGFNLDCSWVIRIPEGRSNQKLILDFTFFHLEQSTDCERDYVAIYTGAKLNKLVGKYCGRQAPPAIVFSADEALRIAFHTDGDMADAEQPTGFALKFYKAPRKLIDSGCNSSAEQVAMGELEKLLVANPRYTECNWLIRPRQMGKQANYPVVRLANAAQIADQSQYTCYMENISYPRYLGKSMKIEPDHRLSSCRIEIRPIKSARTSAPIVPPSESAPSNMPSLGDRRGQQQRPGSRRPPKTTMNPKRRKPADLLNRSRSESSSGGAIRNNNNKRKQMSNDFVSESEDEFDEEVEEVDELDLESLPIDERRQLLRQQRYEQRVAYRARLRAIRKEQNARDREINRSARIEERKERRQLIIEQRNKLLTRTRRGANKKKSGSKQQKDKGKKKGSKGSDNVLNGRITSKSKNKSKNKKPAKGKPSKISSGGGGGKKKQPIVEEFKSCTATMITNKCLLTTAACTGNDKNVNLFAKVGERVYGSNDDGVQTILIKECIKHPKYKAGDVANDLQICYLSEPIRYTRDLMIPCLSSSNMTLDDGDIVVAESRTNFNKGKMDGSPYRTHIPITGKYKKAKEEEAVLRAGYAFGDPLCMKEIGSPVFREDVNQRTLLGLVQGPIAPQNQCPTRLFNIVDLRDHQDWIIDACNLAAHETPPSTSEFTTSSRTGAGSGGNGHGKEKIYVPSKATANDEQCTDNNIELWSFGGNCTEMTVASPNYPNWYPANANCNYNINAPENTKVRVRFVEKFDVEAHPRCLYDSLTITDPFETRNQKRQVTYCNGKDPVLMKENARSGGTQVIGSGNKLSMQFKSDQSTQREGFKLLVDCVAL